MLVRDNRGTMYEVRVVGKQVFARPAQGSSAPLEDLQRAIRIERECFGAEDISAKLREVGFLPVVTRGD